MISSNNIGNDTLIHFVTKAIDLGAMELEVEYEDGLEHIYAVGEYSGVGIASLEPGSDEAQEFRALLCQINKHPIKMVIRGSEYSLKVKIHEEFGENVYNVIFKKVQL